MDRVQYKRGSREKQRTVFVEVHATKCIADHNNTGAQHASHQHFGQIYIFPKKDTHSEVLFFFVRVF